MSAREALERLKSGNREFVSRMQGGDAALNDSRRAELPQIQNPFAIILGCSDARVPAEVVMDLARHTSWGGMVWVFALPAREAAR